MVRTLLTQFGNAEPAEHLKFLAGIESAKSIVDLKEICQYSHSPKLDGLLFSAEYSPFPSYFTKSNSLKETIVRTPE